MTFIHIFLLILILLMALGLFLCNFVANTLANMAIHISPASRPAVHPKMLGYHFEAIELTTSDSLTISAWFVPDIDCNKPVVLIVHGLGASKEHMMGQIELARQNNLSVLAIDVRGHGDSQKSLTSIGHFEQQDVLAAIDFLKSKGFTKVILWGTSMGAVTCIHVAQENPDIIGVMADVPFDTLRNTIILHAKLFYGIPQFPILPLALKKIEKLMQFQLDQVDCMKAVQKINVPILFIAASLDKRMPPELIKSIYDQANEPKKYILLPDEVHEFRRFTDPFKKEISTFLQKIIEKS